MWIHALSIVFFSHKMSIQLFYKHFLGLALTCRPMAAYGRLLLFLLLPFLLVITTLLQSIHLVQRENPRKNMQFIALFTIQCHRNSCVINPIIMIFTDWSIDIVVFYLLIVILLRCCYFCKYSQSLYLYLAVHQPHTEKKTTSR